MKLTATTTRMRPLIITGMHRSGTSLTAGYLHACGLHLGDDLLPADFGNPRGYYEDTEILEFHRSILRHNGTSLFPTRRNLPLETTDEDRQVARGILAARETRGAWGWKEPRTVLLLDFWHELLPQAAYLLLFRHPLAVLDSLIRRGDVEIRRRRVLGLRSWLAYNELLLDFALRNRPHCLVVDIDAVIRAPSALLTGLEARFGLRLAPAPFDTVFSPNELLQDPPAPPRRLRWFFRDDIQQSLVLYERLRVVADEMEGQ